MLLALFMAKPGTRLVMAAVLGVASLLALGAFALLGDDTASRLGRLGHDAAIRHNLAEIGWRMLADALWWGHGLGAFETAGSAYRTSAVPMWFDTRLDHAHNDYVELLAELGWVGGALAALVVLAILLELTRLLRARRRGVMWPALGLGTLALVGSHALVDFSLRMPLVALVTASWLALALRNKDPEALTPAAMAPTPLAPTHAPHRACGSAPGSARTGCTSSAMTTVQGTSRYSG
jgi:O-antigen ligase